MFNELPQQIVNSAHENTQSLIEAQSLEHPLLINAKKAFEQGDYTTAQKKLEDLVYNSTEEELDDNLYEHSIELLSSIYQQEGLQQQIPEHFIKTLYNLELLNHTFKNSVLYIQHVKPLIESIKNGEETLFLHHFNFLFSEIPVLQNQTTSSEENNLLTKFLDGAREIQLLIWNQENNFETTGFNNLQTQLANHQNK